MNLDDLITQSDAARLRNVKPPRINRLIKENRLEVFTIAGKPLVSRTAVLELKALPMGRPAKARIATEVTARGAAEVMTSASPEVGKVVAKSRRKRKAKAARPTRTGIKDKGKSK